MDIETRSIILSRQRTTKALVRLRGGAGWSAPLLFAYGERFSHDVAQIYTKRSVMQYNSKTSKKLHFSALIRYGSGRRRIRNNAHINRRACCIALTKHKQSATLIYMELPLGWGTIRNTDFVVFLRLLLVVSVCHEPSLGNWFIDDYLREDPSTEYRGPCADWTSYELNEPRHEKTCLRGVWPGKTQTGLLSYRDWLESWNVGFSNYPGSEQQRRLSDWMNAQADLRLCCSRIA